MTAPQPSDPLFQRLLGVAVFDALPGPVLALHSGSGTSRWHGEVEVTRGRTVLARLCSWMTRLPPSGTGPITVEIVTDDSPAGQGAEQWTRHFGRHAMRSRLRASGGLLHERLGLVDLRFRLDTPGAGIAWTVVGARVLGLLPLPASWFSQVRAREFAVDGRYGFEVVAALPLAGPLVRYRGWLAVQ